MPKEIYPGLKFFDRGTREWDYMWERLAELEINQGLPDPTVAFDNNTAEAWQYMGTERHGRMWLHTFRHRCHPRTGDRVYERVPVSRRCK